MILINGAQGIGTGFSSKIPSYNPRDIIKNLKLHLQDKELEEINPWWNKFTGNVIKIDELNYELSGKWSIDNNKAAIQNETCLLNLKNCTTYNVV